MDHEAAARALLRDWKKLADKAPKEHSEYVAGIKRRIETAIRAGDEMSFEALAAEVKNRLAKDEWRDLFLSAATAIFSLINKD